MYGHLVCGMRRRGAANKRKLNPIIIVTHSPAEVYMILFFFRGYTCASGVVVVAYAIYERIVLGRGDHTTAEFSFYLCYIYKTGENEKGWSLAAAISVETVSGC